MKYSNNSLSLVFAVTLGLCGCGAIARQPEPTVSGALPGTASAASAKTSAPEARSADSDASGAVNAEPLLDDQEEKQRLVINLLIFGMSYHPDREGVRKHHVDNEINPGIGLSYKISNDAKRVIRLETGIYKDSGSNLARFAGASYHFKLTDRWRLGVDLLAAKSRTYNQGRAFVAPIPHLAYDLGVAKIDAIYIPRMPPFNLYAAFGLYFTVPIRGM